MAADTSAPAASEYDFTVDWFSRFAPVWEQLIARHKPSRFLEIGSYEGRSACFLLEKVATVRPIEVHCVDTWTGSVEHGDTAMQDVERRFDHNIQVAGSNTTAQAKVFKYKAQSADALAQLLAQGKKETFDFIYIDGSHEAPDVLTDCVLAFRLLKVGGVMVFDDYLWIVDQAGELAAVGHEQFYNLPKPAVDAFLNIFQRKMRVLHQYPLYQLYSVKTAS